jgi:hypothetical protein
MLENPVDLNPRYTQDCVYTIVMCNPNEQHINYEQTN